MIPRAGLAAAGSVILAAAASTWAGPQPGPPAPAPGLQVLSVQVLPRGTAPGERRLELSDLAWNPGRRQLLAVSDRGRLHVYGWPGGPSDALAVQPLYRQTLPGRPNLEAMALDPQGQLHLVEEPTGRVSTWADAGPQAWRPVDVPPRAPARPAGTVSVLGHGIEAAMWWPGEGLALARQHPVEGRHRIVFGSGMAWSLRPTGARSTLKALARLDAQRWVALEKLSRPGPDGFVRRVGSAACRGDDPCATHDLPLVDPRLEPRDNFEGLACLGDGRCLLVTDDGGQADERTLLVLIRISPPATAPGPPSASPPAAPGRR